MYPESHVLYIELSIVNAKCSKTGKENIIFTYEKGEERIEQRGWMDV
jgi:hypothetical protein